MAASSTPIFPDIHKLGMLLRGVKQYLKKPSHSVSNVVVLLYAKSCLYLFWYALSSNGAVPKTQTTFLNTVNQSFTSQTRAILSFFGLARKYSKPDLEHTSGLALSATVKFNEWFQLWPRRGMRGMSHLPVLSMSLWGMDCRHSSTNEQYPQRDSAYDGVVAVLPPTPLVGDAAMATFPSKVVYVGAGTIRRMRGCLTLGTIVVVCIMILSCYSILCAVEVFSSTFFENDELRRIQWYERLSMSWSESDWDVLGLAVLFSKLSSLLLCQDSLLKDQDRTVSPPAIWSDLSDKRCPIVQP